MTFNNSVLIVHCFPFFQRLCHGTTTTLSVRVGVPDINTILSSATDGWPTAKDKWDNKYQSIITR